jgi:hypothetical protein
MSKAGGCLTVLVVRGGVLMLAGRRSATVVRSSSASA